MIPKDTLEKLELVIQEAVQEMKSKETLTEQADAFWIPILAFHREHLSKEHFGESQLYQYFTEKAQEERGEANV